MEETIYILVAEDDDVWFEGTMEHWMDAFFANPNEDNMREFAEFHKSRLFKQV